MHLDRVSSQYRCISLKPNQDYHWLSSAQRHGGDPLTVRVQKAAGKGEYTNLVLKVRSVQAVDPPAGSSQADQECYLVKGFAEGEPMEILIDIGPDKNGRTKIEE